MNVLTSKLFSGADLTFESFEQEVWRQRACVLGSLDLSTMTHLRFSDFIALTRLEAVESRLLTEHRGKRDEAPSHFHLEFGPFSEEEFSGLEPREMLMIQNLESLIPEVSDWLTQQFQFLPRWRIEDVMATLAHRGGNCGAHFDQYDVFLVQLSGKKRWQLDDGQHKAEDLRDDSDIRLLKAFVPTSEYTLEPGQVLYVPPGVGHHGIASDDCITLSVGVRNPLLSEMAAYLADMLLQEIESENSLNDALGGTEISTTEIQSLSQEVVSAIGDHGLMSQWYGRYMTEPRDPELLALPEDGLADSQVANWLNEQVSISLALTARIAVQQAMVFINGESLELTTPARWLVELQQKRTVECHQIPSEDIYILEALVTAGGLAGLPEDWFSQNEEQSDDRFGA